MKDTCVCPACNIELDVGEYGYGMECSECGCKLDVFPNTSLFLETVLGTFGISIPEKE